MILMIFTQDYPFGYSGETFLEEEIRYLALKFPKIIIISTSKIRGKRREVPEGIIVIKAHRWDNLVSCATYAIRKFFTYEAYKEFRDMQLMRYKPSLWVIIKAWLINWMIEKRLEYHFNKIWNGEPVILYSYWLDNHAYFIAKMKKKYPQIHTIARAHAFEVYYSHYYNPFIRTTDMYLDKIVFISNYTQREYEFILKNINNSIRAKQFISRLGVRENNEIKINNPLGIMQIVSCSQIIQQKRLDLIIDALSLISNGASIHWSHFGGGPDYKKIQDYAHKILDDKINISYKLYGPLYNVDVLDYYNNNNVDYFINTSDNEGIPVSIMESMSFGIPCIGRDVGGINEIIIDQVSGYILPKEVRAEMIAKKLEYLFNQRKINPNSSIELRYSTFRFWKDNYNGRNNYQQFINDILNPKNL